MRARVHERQIIVTDSTIEALALTLRQSPHGLCYAQDELTSLTSGFDRYRRGVGSDRQFFQSAWSGQPICVNRIRVVNGVRELDTLRVDRPFLSVVGGIPPDMLGEIPDERGREDGFPHRFLWCFPDSAPFHYNPEGVSDEARQGFQDLVDGLLTRIPLSLLGDTSTHFTDEGSDRWDAFMRAHTAEMNESAFPDHLCGPWKKLASYCARFALILQLSQYVCGEADGILVDETSVANAVTLVDYFKSHARRTYRHLRAEPTNERVAALLEWIAERGGRASVRDVVTARVAACRNKGDAVALFERLKKIGVGAIQTKKNETGGRPTIFFVLGPGDDC